MYSKIELFKNKILIVEADEEETEEELKVSNFLSNNIIKVLKYFSKNKKILEILNNNKDKIFDVKEIFNEIDTDNNKKITVEEFKAGIKELLNTEGYNSEILAAFIFVGAIKTKFPKVFTEKGLLRAVQQADLANNLKIKDEALFNIFFELGKNNQYSFTPEARALNDCLENLEGFKLSKELAKNFPTFEQTKNIIDNIDEAKLEGNFKEPNNLEKIDEIYKKILDGESLSDEEKAKLPDSAVEKTEDTNEKLGGSDPKNVFGLGISIPEDEEIVKKEKYLEFSQEIENIFSTRMEKIMEKYFNSKSEMEKRKNEKNNSKLNDLVSECLKKKGFVLKEEGEKKSTLEKFKEAQEKEFGWSLENFRKKAGKLCASYAGCDNYKKSLDIVASLYELYVNLAYDATKRLKEIKKSVEIQAKNLDNKHQNFEDPKEKEYNEHQAALSATKGAEEIKSFLSNSNVNDVKNLAKYVLIEIFTADNINNSENLIKLLNGNFENIKIYTGGSKNVFGTKLATDLKEDFFEFANGTPYKNVSSLLAAAGIKTGIFTKETVKKIYKELKSNENIEKLKKDAECYNNCCKYLSDVLKNASKNNTSASVVTEGLMNFINQKKAQKDGPNNDMYNKSNEGASNDKEFLEKNSYHLKLNAPDGGNNKYEPMGDGPEDLAFRQLFKGLVVKKIADNEFYVMSAKTYKLLKSGKYKTNQQQTNQQQSLDNSLEKGSATEQAIQDNANQASGQVMDSIKTEPKATVTTSSADSTYPGTVAKETPQQKIKKICYGISPEGRYSIKSKEFFN